MLWQHLCLKDDKFPTSHIFSEKMTLLKIEDRENEVLNYEVVRASN